MPGRHPPALRRSPVWRQTAHSLASGKYPPTPNPCRPERSEGSAVVSGNATRQLLPSWRRDVQRPNCRPRNQLGLQSMEQLGLSNSAHRSDEYYREHWSSYYAERRRLLNRMAWLAGGLGIFFLLFIAVTDRHPGLRYLPMVPCVILLLALPAQWFLLTWRIGGLGLSAMWRILFRLDIRPKSVWAEVQALRTCSTKGIGS